MGLYKAEGIVLKAKAYGEADSILTVFTKEHGKTQLLAKGSRKTKSKKRGSVQPFTYSKFLIYEGKSLDTITQGDIIESFSHLGEDYDLMTLGFYCCELVENFLPEKEVNDELFNLLIKTFYVLPFTDKELLIRAFELQVLNIMGYFPELKACVHCQTALSTKLFFSSSLGGIICESCRQSDIYSISCNKRILVLLEQLIKIDSKKLKILKVNQEDKALIQKITETYIRSILEKTLKSLIFIKSLT